MFGRQSFLKKLQIQKNNPGAGMGHDWWSDAKGDKHTSVTPVDGSPIADVFACSNDDYDVMLDKAMTAAKAWRQVPAPQRGDIIRQMGDALRANKDALGSLVSYEMGKSKAEGDGEVQEMIDIADFAVGQSRMLYGKTMHSERPQHRMYEQWHPYGIVGVISAFNFPVAVWSWNAFIAAICGNVTIWKPSAKTPLCAVAVQHICNAVLKANDCPPIFGYFVPADHDLAERFIQDERIALVSFTGSTHTGRHVAEVVAKRLGNTILELGGNNAIIIDETADLALAIPAVVFGAVGTAGQRCTTTRRLLVHRSRYQDVVEKLKHAYAQVTIGDPLDPKNLMGPLIDADAVAMYQAALEAVSVAGGKIVFGGKVLDHDGFYVEPTVVTGVQNDWDIVQTETFAPILYVMAYDDLDNALALHNGVRQGLSSAIFTKDLTTAERFLSAAGSDCGLANVNIGTSGAEIGGAFGGEKDTGGGRESGSDAWKAYMRRQTSTINWGDDLPLAQGIKFDVG
jgi:L-aminoadipate-semialdehyde dehydrogenase